MAPPNAAIRAAVARLQKETVVVSAEVPAAIELLGLLRHCDATALVGGHLYASVAIIEGTRHACRLPAVLVATVVAAGQLSEPESSNPAVTDPMLEALGRLVEDRPGCKNAVEAVEAFWQAGHTSDRSARMRLLCLALASGNLAEASQAHSVVVGRTLNSLVFNASASGIGVYYAGWLRFCGAVLATLDPTE